MTLLAIKSGAIANRNVALTNGKSGKRK